MIHPVKSVKNHVARNRTKYAVVTHATAVAAGVVVGQRVLLANQFFSHPEAFEMMYPSPK